MLDWFLGLHFPTVSDGNLEGRFVLKVSWDAFNLFTDIIALVHFAKDHMLAIKMFGRSKC